MILINIYYNQYNNILHQFKIQFTCKHKSKTLRRIKNKQNTKIPKYISKHSQCCLQSSIFSFAHKILLRVYNFQQFSTVKYNFSFYYMENKPQCFYNNIKSRKNSKVHYGTLKLSPKISFLSNKSSLEQLSRNKDNGSNRTTNYQNNSSRYNDASIQTSDIDTNKNIPSILAKFVSQNQQLAKERHSLFQKNCQLVNKIKQLENVGNLTKIKSLKSLQVPKQQFITGHQGKVLSPNLYYKNNNLENNDKKANKRWLFDSIKNQSKDKLFNKKSGCNALNDFLDINTTKKKFFKNTSNSFQSNLCQGQYKLAEAGQVRDIISKQQSIANCSEQTSNIQQTNKSNNFLKMKAQLIKQQASNKYHKPTSKTQYFFPSHLADQQTKQSQKTFQPQKVQKPKFNKSNINLSKQNSISKLDSYEKEYTQKLTFEANQQPITPLWFGHQNIFKKTSSNYTQPPKSKRAHTEKPTAGGIQRKLLRIKQQNNQLRKQLCYFK